MTNSVDLPLWGVVIKPACLPNALILITGERKKGRIAALAGARLIHEDVKLLLGHSCPTFKFVQPIETRERDC